jgi:hypothetical protein
MALQRVSFSSPVRADALYEIVNGEIGRFFELDGTVFTLPEGNLAYMNVGEENPAWYEPPLPPEPDAPPPEVPFSISALQARKALRAAGLREAVEEWVQAQDAAIIDEWEYATQVERTNTWLSAGAASLGLTEEQIDGLFILGATL